MSLFREFQWDRHGLPSTGTPTPDRIAFHDTQFATELWLDFQDGETPEEDGWRLHLDDGQDPGLDLFWSTKSAASQDLPSIVKELERDGYDGVIVVFKAPPREDEPQRVVWFGY